MSRLSIRPRVAFAVYWDASEGRYRVARVTMRQQAEALERGETMHVFHSLRLACRAVQDATASRARMMS